jgi:hypothetical protein
MSESFPSIRSQYHNLDAGSALEKPCSILLGISEAAASALSNVGIVTVFDLASSGLFANAVAICQLAETGQGRFAATGKVPRDVLRDGHDKPIKELPLQPVSLLGGYGTKPALKALADAIDIETIRDLAAWPPYRSARQLLDHVYNPLAVNGVLDNESPADLRPANGEYPTERVQYEVILFDSFVESPELPRVRLPEGVSLPKSLGESGVLDISRLLANDEGYQRPAIGGVLTFTQSWYTKGLALGNLLHGVALGPGESTKIAMIDWSRKTRASATEAIQEDETLDSSVSRTRSLNEITNAVARETQSGSSGAHIDTSATQYGESRGSAGLNLFSPGVETSGMSFGRSTGKTDSSSWSTSSGERDVGASLTQNIVDRTQQASHSARNRRASIVREVSQQESESVSTRTLTNYNHMHALTVEYYEVVQLYRTVVELSKADRCVFIPMKLIDFGDPAVRKRFRFTLAAAGLIAEVRALALIEPDQIALSCPTRDGDWSANNLRELALGLKRQVGQPQSPYLVLPKDFVKNFTFGFGEEAPIEQAIITFSSGSSVTVNIRKSAEPGGATGGNAWQAAFPAETGSMFDTAKNERTFGDIKRIELVKKADNAEYTGTLNITFSFYNEEASVPLDIPNFAMNIRVKVPKESARFSIAEVNESVGDEELTQHLVSNRLYYSQVIWRSLDPATIGILLSNYNWTIGGKRRLLVEIVDPTPVSIIANYLVLRLSADDKKELENWLDHKKIKLGSKREDLVPVPCSGVFAEAVLGRFNAAEKLDITRFWNWQDSPIPIAAPDIAPIQAGSRRESDPIAPGQLSAPVLNIVNPPALPDPQGMGAVLTAIQNGNMFRDMSGLAATIGLAQAGLAGAQQGASDAAAQAGQNAAVAAQLGAKVAELAAKIVAAYFTGGASLAAGAGVEGLAGLAGGISGQGAKINQGKDMDKRGIPPKGVGAANGARTGAIQSSSSGTSSDGGESGGSAASGTPSVGNESAAFYNALGGRPGGLELVSSDQQLDTTRLAFLLQDSVGQGGVNDAEDVRVLQSRLASLGFDWLSIDGRMGAQTVDAIRLFQSIVNGHETIAGHAEVTGLVKVGDSSYQWLQAINSPRWQLMPVGSWDEGFFNVERMDANDTHDYGTNWMSDTITAAGEAYARDYLNNRADVGTTPALLTINDVSLPSGGNTPDHKGHESGLSCDLRLPRKDGTAPGNTKVTDANYDQDAMRAMLTAFKKQPLWNVTFFNDPDLVTEGLCAVQVGHDDHAHIGIKVPQKGGAELMNGSGTMII